MTARTDTSRSLLHWALQELAGYALAALGGVLAFTVWAVIYTYVWPGKPPTWIDTPAPAIDVPAPPASRIPVEAPAPAPSDVSPAIARVPSDALPVELLRMLSVYDPSNEKIGHIEDVLVGRDGKVVVYIVGVGDWVVGGQGKNIAVPFEAVKFKMSQAACPSTGNCLPLPVLNLTKDAILEAPKQKFDPSILMWVPDPAR